MRTIDRELDREDGLGVLAPEVDAAVGQLLEAKAAQKATIWVKVDVDVRFGPFTCIAGPNGVGKSNLFDAIRFLSALAEKRFGRRFRLSVKHDGEGNLYIADNGKHNVRKVDVGKTALHFGEVDVDAASEAGTLHVRSRTEPADPAPGRTGRCR